MGRTTVCSPRASRFRRLPRAAPEAGVSSRAPSPTRWAPGASASPCRHRGPLHPRESAGSPWRVLGIGHNPVRSPRRRSQTARRPQVKSTCPARGWSVSDLPGRPVKVRCLSAAVRAPRFDLCAIEFLRSAALTAAERKSSWFQLSESGLRVVTSLFCFFRDTRQDIYRRH